MIGETAGVEVSAWREYFIRGSSSFGVPTLTVEDGDSTAEAGERATWIVAV